MAGLGEQGAQHLRLAGGAQTEGQGLAGRQLGALGGGDLSGEAAALVDQAQQLSVEGVDAPSDFIEGSRLVGA